MFEITMFHYLFLGLLVFLIGLVGSILSRNIIKILVAIEFMLTGVNINFITFTSFCDSTNFDGYIFALFYIAIGAVELAVALYIFYLMYKHKESENVDNYGDL